MKQFAFIFLSFALLTSCGTLYLQDSKNVSNQKNKYDKILVISRFKNMTARISLEDAVVARLTEANIKAEPSYKTIKTERLSKELSEAEVEAMVDDLSSKGFTGIIINNYLSKDQYQEVVPGGASIQYYPVRYGRFGRYFGMYPMTTWAPDTVEAGVEFTLESCLYDLKVPKEDNLQWVGHFVIKDPSSLSQVSKIYSKELVNALLEESIML